MSRHSFFQIITNSDDFLNIPTNSNQLPMTDTKGNSFEQWGSFGVVGWDESQQSYFINIEAETDESSWMMGNYPHEIPTFNSLCDAINRIFAVTEGTFAFKDNINVPKKISEPESEPVIKTEDGALQVDYYHEHGDYAGNIMWPKVLGKNKATHPVHSIKEDENSPIVKFRALGYFASCFPEGDGITMTDDSKKKSPQQVMKEIKDCFGWHVVLKTTQS